MRWSLLLAHLVALALAPAGSAQTRRTPVLVELFTSEGCSSCPPADTLLEKLIDAQPIDGVQLVGLGQHVDYWDHQGWKDRFASPVLTARQQQYARAFGIDSIYTPQMVVDGRSEFVGSDAAAARRAIEQAARAPHGLVLLTVDGTNPARVGVDVLDLPTVSRGDRADIVVAVAESELRSDVRAGENKGRALTHAAVVRHMKTIGEAADGHGTARADLAIDRSWAREHLTVVAFVQERVSRRILASAATPLASRP